MQRFTAILENFNSNLWGFHFEVPNEIAELLIANGDKRMVCELNGSVQFQCALLPNKGIHYILINKQLRHKFSLTEGDKIQVKLWKDQSEYGIDMSDEMRLIFEEDVEAKTYFDALSPGKKRSLIYLVVKVKNTDSRINKSLAIAEHLKVVAGELEYKQLNETIKKYNSLNKLKV